MDLSQFKGMCEKCRKRKGCKVSCAPVEMILRDGNPEVFEKTNYKHNAIMLFPADRNERRESTLRAGARDKQAHNKIDAIFSTDGETAFCLNNPQTDKTTVFIYKVFNGFSFQDIATMLDKPVDNVRVLFHKAKERILKALDLCDTRSDVISKAEYSLQVNEQATGKLPKYQKWFLMNKCLGLTPAEIANLEGTNRTNVTAKIKYCADRLKTGDLIFLDPTPEQIRESQERIEKKRARDRKRAA